MTSLEKYRVGEMCAVDDMSEGWVRVHRRLCGRLGLVEVNANHVNRTSVDSKCLRRKEEVLKVIVEGRGKIERYGGKNKDSMPKQELVELRRMYRVYSEYEALVRSQIEYVKTWIEAQGVELV